MTYNDSASLTFTREELERRDHDFVAEIESQMRNTVNHTQVYMVYQRDRPRYCWFHRMFKTQRYAEYLNKLYDVEMNRRYL